VLKMVQSSVWTPLEEEKSIKTSLRFGSRHFEEYIRGLYYSCCDSTRMSSLAPWRSLWRFTQGRPHSSHTMPDMTATSPPNADGRHLWVHGGSTGIRPAPQFGDGFCAQCAMEVGSPIERNLSSTRREISRMSVISTVAQKEENSFERAKCGT
jgi:hypothetical protein